MWMSVNRKSAMPFKFSIDIEDPEYREGWADELQVFHNPNALHPLHRDLFPQATHHFLEDGEVKSYSLPNKVLESVTLIHLPIPKHR